MPRRRAFITIECACGRTFVVMTRLRELITGVTLTMLQHKREDDCSCAELVFTCLCGGKVSISRAEESDALQWWLFKHSYHEHN